MSKKGKNENLHAVPADVKKLISSSVALQSAWEKVTPLARNEWVCWVISGKLAETRAKRLKRMHEELMEGKRRPCCWAGCMHRTDKALSPSQKFILSRQGKDK